MKEKNTSLPRSVIAAILFVISALLQLKPLFYSFRYANSYAGGFLTLFSYLVTFVGIALIAYALFTARRDRLLVIGFALPAAAKFLGGLSFFSLLSFLAWAGAALIAAAFFTERLPQLRESGKKFCFLPAVLLALLGIFHLLRGIFGYYFNTTCLPLLFQAGGTFFALLWVTQPETTLQDSVKADSSGFGSPAQSAARRETPAVPADRIYCSLVKHILLLLFTFGIWYLIWIYRMTGYLNCVGDEEPRTPTSQLLLCMFVPFYSIYWVYKSAQRIDKLAASRSIPSDFSTLCLILAIFVAVIPPILMQEKINTIVTAADSPARPQLTYAKPAKPDLGTAEELKTYKELFDSGVITQDEFDAKKKQLLGV